VGLNDKRLILWLVADWNIRHRDQVNNNAAYILAKIVPTDVCTFSGSSEGALKQLMCYAGVAVNERVGLVDSKIEELAEDKATVTFA
jgi:hypothetical protein